jgi:hypothetical protein
LSLRRTTYPSALSLYSFGPFLLSDFVLLAPTFPLTSYFVYSTTPYWIISRSSITFSSHNASDLALQALSHLNFPQFSLCSGLSPQLPLNILNTGLTIVWDVTIYAAVAFVERVKLPHRTVAVILAMLVTFYAVITRASAIFSRTITIGRFIVFSTTHHFRCVWSLTFPVALPLVSLPQVPFIIALRKNIRSTDRASSLATSHVLIWAGKLALSRATKSSSHDRVRKYT